MAFFGEKWAFRSMRGKLIAAFLVGSIAIAVSWFMVRSAFREVNMNVAALTRPNEKLRMVNDLFRSISQQELEQHTEYLQQNTGAYEDFFRKQDAWQQKLDSLKDFYRGDSAQTQRIDAMKHLLVERNRQLLEYIRFKMDLLSNKALSKRLDQISNYLSSTQAELDTNVVSTEHVTTTTTFEEPRVDSSRPQSFFKRIFRKKKTETPVIRRQVQENVHVTVDTVAIAQRDSLLTAMGQALNQMEKDQHSRSESVIRRELQLATSNNLFISQLISLLREVEQEEMNVVNLRNENVKAVISQTIQQIGLVFLAFFILTLFLILWIVADMYRSNNYRLQLLEAKEEAERLSTVKQRFLANMSHELRTPLQAIIGFSEQALQQQPAQREGLHAIHDSSEHLLQIVNEVLDYSRIVSGRFNFEKQDFELQALVLELARTMEMQARKKGLAFRFHSEVPAGHYYSGDAFRLKQILYNLLGNAVKFTNKGEVSFVVTVEARPKKTSFHFEIRDTGIGIPQADQERVFNLFEQANHATAQMHSGTGLGLSIVKSLVEMQGGSIQLDSSEGEGSVFRVKLTYLHAKALAPPEAPLKANWKGPLYKGKVMLVDDDALILQLCSGILEKHHIGHVRFSSPMDVLAADWDPQITFVLLDIRMPGMSGMELCHAIRQRAGNEVRIYALTAQAFPEEREAMFRQGFDGVLIKPFREKELLQVITGKDVVPEAVIEETPSQEPEIDLMSIVRMSMGDKELLAQNLAILQSTTREDLAYLEQALREKNAQEVSHYVHRLAGKTAQAGARSLAHELRLQEKKLEAEGLLPSEMMTLRQICESLKKMILKIEEEALKLMK